jgi:hypothetical protein
MWDKKCLNMRRITSQPCMKGDLRVVNPKVALTLPPLLKPKHALLPCYNICGHAKHTPMLKNTLPLHVFFYVHWPTFYHMILGIFISHIHLLSFNKWLIHGSKIQWKLIFSCTHTIHLAWCIGGCLFTLAPSLYVGSNTIFHPTNLLKYNFNILQVSLKEWTILHNCEVVYVRTTHNVLKGVVKQK